MTKVLNANCIIALIIDAKKEYLGMENCAFPSEVRAVSSMLQKKLNEIDSNIEITKDVDMYDLNVIDGAYYFKSGYESEGKYYMCLTPKNTTNFHESYKILTNLESIAREVLKAQKEKLMNYTC